MELRLLQNTNNNVPVVQNKICRGSLLLNLSAGHAADKLPQFEVTHHENRYRLKKHLQKSIDKEMNSPVSQSVQPGHPFLCHFESVGGI